MRRAGFTLYQPPAAAARALTLVPRLESWMKAEHSDQLRLAAFLDHVESVLGQDLAEVEGPLAVAYDVGVPAERERFGGGDLDNYAFPVRGESDRGASPRFGSQSEAAVPRRSSSAARCSRGQTT